MRLNKNVYFIISYISFGEFIAHKDLLLSKNHSVTNALNILNKFIKSLDRNLYGGPSLNIDLIVKRYKNHSRHTKFLQAGFSDFMLLTQAEEINNVRILTCDKKMCICGRKIFKNRIYYLPNKSRGLKSDYPKLMSELQNAFK